MIPIRDDNPTLRAPVVTIAIIVLNVLAWLVLQLLGGLPQLGGGGAGVAFWAHIGGFAAGAALILAFRDPELVAEHRRVVMQGGAATVAGRAPRCPAAQRPGPAHRGDGAKRWRVGGRLV